MSTEKSMIACSPLGRLALPGYLAGHPKNLLWVEMRGKHQYPAYRPGLKDSPHALLSVWRKVVGRDTQDHGEANVIMHPMASADMLAIGGTRPYIC